MRKRKPLIVLSIMAIICAMVLLLLCNRKKSTPDSISGFMIQDTAIHISGNKLVIRIWDYSATDGDTVNILFDGQRIFSKLGIQDSAVEYETTKLSNGMHWLGVEAVNEGSNPPATPHISINNGDTLIEFEIESYLNKPAARQIIIQ